MAVRGETLEVRTEDSTLTYQKVAPGIMRFAVAYDQAAGVHAGRTEVRSYANGSVWQLVVQGKTGGDGYFLSGDKREPLDTSTQSVFIPPFSISEFQCDDLKGGWWGYLGVAELPDSFPKQPVVFRSPIAVSQEVTGVDDLESILDAAEELQSADRSDHPCDMVVEARSYLNHHYDELSSIGDLAGMLEVSHSELTRSFKQAYGVAPLRYRNQLRVEEALRHMLFGASCVTETAFQVGFEDLSRFNKNFRRVRESKPSQFVFRA